MSAWQRMKERWGVSTWGVVAIVAAFSLAGSTTIRISGPIMNMVLPPGSPRWLWWICRIVVIVPVYQVVLMIFGTLLGQFTFFWNKEKAMGRLLMRPFRQRS